MELEILLTPRGDGLNFTKQVRVNGVGKRSMDLIGMLRAVLFLPEDIKLVEGSPGERRRYLDIALCQIDPVYCRALSAYQKVTTQRNSLLKTLREQGARPGSPTVEAQLGFWDEKLVQHGSRVVGDAPQLYAAIADPWRRRSRPSFPAGARTCRWSICPASTTARGPMRSSSFGRTVICWRIAAGRGMATVSSDARSRRR